METTTHIIEETRDLRGRIIDAARQLFLDHGYSKVSTAEIAQALGVSKKTLYKEFENKEEILRAVILPKLHESARAVDDVLGNDQLPFLEKLRSIMTMIGFQHQKVSTVLMKDVYVHCPEVWSEIQKHKRKRYERFGALLQEGIDKQVFRSDINPEIIHRMYMNSIDTLMTPTSLGELPCTAQEVFRAILTIMFEGVLRDESRAALQQPS